MVREDSDTVVATRGLAEAARWVIGVAAATTKAAAHDANTWHVVIAGARSHGSSLDCWSGADVSLSSRGPGRASIPMSRIAEALMLVPVRSLPDAWPTHVSPLPASTSWNESAKASKVATRRRCIRESVGTAFPSHLYGIGAGMFSKLLLGRRIERQLRLMGPQDVGHMRAPWFSTRRDGSLLSSVGSRQQPKHRDTSRVDTPHASVPSVARSVLRPDGAAKNDVLPDGLLGYFSRRWLWGDCAAAVAVDDCARMLASAVVTIRLTRAARS